MSREEVAEPDGDVNVVSKEASSGVGLRLEDSASTVYGKGEPLVSEVKDIGSKKKKLSSPMI